MHASVAHVLLEIRRKPADERTDLASQQEAYRQNQYTRLSAWLAFLDNHMKEEVTCPDRSLHVQESSHLVVIGVCNSMCDIQEHRNAVGVACSIAFREHLHQALPASWRQGRQLQDFQRMPGYFIAVPASHAFSAGG